MCRAHEEIAHDWEEYAIEFCRRYSFNAPQPGQKMSISVQNPDPSSLVMFAHIVIWRHAAAYSAIERMLGPYFKTIQDAVFSGKPPLEVMLIDPGHTRNGTRAQIGICPSIGRLGGRRTVRFDIGGLGFITKTDRRNYEWPLDHSFSAALNPVIVLQKEPVEITKNPEIRRSVSAGRLIRGN